MQTASRIATITPAQDPLTIPSALIGAMGPYFVDALPLPDGTGFQSAAILGSRLTSTGDVLAVLGWTADSNSLQLAPASLGPFTAVCGAPGGSMALARVDENIPYIELHETGLTDSDWPRVGTITFDGISGRIPAILQRSGTLYGFVKTGGGSKNAFFSVEARDGATPNISYYDYEAPFAYFPMTTDGSLLAGIARPVAFHENYLYAIGESHAYVLYAALDGSSVTQLAIPKSDTWGISIDEEFGRAYGLYHPTSGDIMPYNIHGDGGWDRQGYDTLDGGFSASMAVDPNTAVLYTASAYFGLQVFDVQTNQTIPTSPRDHPLGAYFPYGGIWTDWAHGRILLSMNGQDDSIPRIGFYQVSISG
ncbi:hypothetical protein BOSP111201_19460 [Bordetella sputigena]|uniref:hypothetical protein n=1 Tax=Bordetella sputigena TaxID=1416810 RepID=UPI0039EFB2E2